VLYRESTKRLLHNKKINITLLPPLVRSGFDLALSSTERKNYLNVAE